MELMFLVYLVNMISPVGWLLIVIPIVVCIVYVVMSWGEYVDVRAEDGKRVLLNPLLNIPAGTVVNLNMYSNYGYVTWSEGKDIRIDRSIIQKALTPKNTGPNPPSKLWLIVFLTGFLLPNKETTIYMVGAYMVQQVVTSDTAKELGNLAVDATKAQLKAWSTQSPELAQLLVQAGINEVTAQVKQAEMDKL